MRNKSITQKQVTKWVKENPNATYEEMLKALDPNSSVPNKTIGRLKDRFIKAHEDLMEDAPTVSIGGTLESPDLRRDKAQGRTFVFTSAQSNTLLHEKFFNGLLKYCKYKDAQLHISRFTYNKQGLSSKNSKVGSAISSDTDDTWFDPRIEPYVSDTSLEITKDLVWCGELNILPTRVNPISGFKTYTRQASSILPHAKMFMESIPTMKHDPVKMIYTTGAVTQRNYIQKAAGQKADFHHVFGALIVEVDENDNWWVRQLNADKEGSFYDLDVHVHATHGIEYPQYGVTTGNRVQAITHGDLHGNKLNSDISSIVFDKTNGVLDMLKPYEQYFHDTIDFQPRNHHNIKDTHFLHDMHCKGTSSVKEEFTKMGVFYITEAYREWCKSYVVVSNHDVAINAWLKNKTALSDPVNVTDWYYLNYKAAKAREENSAFNPFSYWLHENINEVAHWFDFKGDLPVILEEDSSHKILDEIEAALHGHLGPNGARGTPRNLASAGKVNSGHTHSAGIFEGVYTAGVYGNLDMGYNKGLSSWSHSMVVTYKNAKRAILTIKNGKAWR